MCSAAIGLNPQIRSNNFLMILVAYIFGLGWELTQNLAYFYLFTLFFYKLEREGVSHLEGMVISILLTDASVGQRGSQKAESLWENIFRCWGSLNKLKTTIDFLPLLS